MKEQAEVIDMLQELRMSMYERLSIMDSMGGDWNAGYCQGVRYSMGLISNVVRKLEKEMRPDIDKNHKFTHYSIGSKDSK